jgi:uncharacterized protein
MGYERDEGKAAANLSKHGVAFEEANTVFNDPLYVDFYDPDHSLRAPLHYHRRISAGCLLLVSYTERGDVIRLISPRRSEPAFWVPTGDGWNDSMVPLLLCVINRAPTERTRSLRPSSLSLLRGLGSSRPISIRLLKNSIYDAR